MDRTSRIRQTNRKTLYKTRKTSVYNCKKELTSARTRARVLAAARRTLFYEHTSLKFWVSNAFPPTVNRTMDHGESTYVGSHKFFLRDTYMLHLGFQLQCAVFSDSENKAARVKVQNNIKAIICLLKIRFIFLKEEKSSIVELTRLLKILFHMQFNSCGRN